jgi:hypothetical protein
MKKKMISLLLLGSVSAALMSGCTGTTVVYVPQPSHTGRDVGITLAVVGAGVAITFLAVHGSHFVKGCAVADPDGLALTTGDGQSFKLVGATASIHPGETLRVKGRKGKKDKSGSRNFLVDEVTKDYGPCSAVPAKS